MHTKQQHTVVTVLLFVTLAVTAASLDEKSDDQTKCDGGLLAKSARASAMLQARAQSTKTSLVASPTSASLHLPSTKGRTKLSRQLGYGDNSSEAGMFFLAKSTPGKVKKIYLKEARTCIHTDLQEAHLRAVRRHAAVLVQKRQAKLLQAQENAKRTVTQSEEKKIDVEKTWYDLWFVQKRCHLNNPYKVIPEAKNSRDCQLMCSDIDPKAIGGGFSHHALLVCCTFSAGAETDWNPQESEHRRRCSDSRRRAKGQPIAWEGSNCRAYTQRKSQGTSVFSMPEGNCSNLALTMSPHDGLHTKGPSTGYDWQQTSTTNFVATTTTAKTTSTLASTTPAPTKRKATEVASASPAPTTITTTTKTTMRTSTATTLTTTTTTPPATTTTTTTTPTTTATTTTTTTTMTTTMTTTTRTTTSTTTATTTTITTTTTTTTTKHVTRAPTTTLGEKDTVGTTTEAPIASTSQTVGTTSKNSDRTTTRRTTQGPSTSSPSPIPTEAPTEAPTTTKHVKRAPTTTLGEEDTVGTTTTESPIATTTQTVGTTSKNLDRTATRKTTQGPPTSSPTPIPTEAPSEVPTESPATEAPTKASTEASTTETPAEAPTEAPTEPPATEAPTPAPSPPALNEADAETASLDASGFKAVTSNCCPSQMEVFFNRLLGSQGLSMCSEPHIQGLMHWFTCVPDMEFQYMLDLIANGNPCKYWIKSGDECPALSPLCAGHYCR